jgi:hypothetical protein
VPEIVDSNCTHLGLLEHLRPHALAEVQAHRVWWARQPGKRPSVTRLGWRIG